MSPECMCILVFSANWNDFSKCVQAVSVFKHFCQTLALVKNTSNIYPDCEHVLPVLYQTGIVDNALSNVFRLWVYPSTFCQTGVTDNAEFSMWVYSEKLCPTK